LNNLRPCIHDVGMASGSDKQLIEQLSHSAVYRDYERTFSTATPDPAGRALADGAARPEE
jgi:hypothetical protein